MLPNHRTRTPPLDCSTARAPPAAALQPAGRTVVKCFARRDFTLIVTSQESPVILHFKTVHDYVPAAGQPTTEGLWRPKTECRDFTNEDMYWYTHLSHSH